MTERLSTTELHDRFIDAVGPTALIAANTDASGELVVELRAPLPGRVRVYRLFAFEVGVRVRSVLILGDPS